MTIGELIDRLANDESCEATLARKLPELPTGLELPADIREFYQAFSSAMLFRDSECAIEVVAPERFVRANPVIVGDDCPEDISFDWFIVAESGGQYLTVDLHPKRRGRCYDSFWDRHGVAGDCPIVAFSFTELLEQLLDARGEYWYWLQDEFDTLGDAYDLSME